MFPKNRNYLRRERKDAILQRVQFAGAQNSHVPRFPATEAELLVPSQVRVQMTQDPRWLHLNRSHIGDRLHVQIMFSEFVPNIVVFGQDDHLYHDIGFLLRTQATIQRVQFTDGEESLEK